MTLSWAGPCSRQAFVFSWFSTTRLQPTVPRIRRIDSIAVRPVPHPPNPAHPFPKVIDTAEAPLTLLTAMHKVYIATAPSKR